VPSGWQLVGSGDFFGNGSDDLLLQNGAGTLVEWQLSNGQYAGGTLIGTAPSGWHVAGTGDFWGTGTDDLLLQDTAGNVVAWQLSNGQYAGGSFIGTAPSGWQIAAVGDYDGDGTSDILLEDPGGNVVTWKVSGGQYAGGSFVGTVPSGWQIEPKTGGATPGTVFAFGDVAVPPAAASSTAALAPNPVQPNIGCAAASPVEGQPPPWFGVSPGHGPPG